MSIFDVAQICMNGHVINDAAETYIGYNANFCSICSSKAITKCDKCNESIRGRIKDYYGSIEYISPAYCHNCGSPFPWTAKGLDSAKALIEEDDQLTSEDKTLFSNSLSDVTSDTPATALAATRIKRIIGKMSSSLKDVAYKAVIDISSEAAVKILKL